MAACIGVSASYATKFTSDMVSKIGEHIWQSETKGDDNKLIFWKDGENHASCGIGHFVWFPSDIEKTCDEQFPDLLRYLQEEGVSLPHWLEKDLRCPWPDKTTFDTAKNKNEVYIQELNRLLSTTRDKQAYFIIKRFHEHVLAEITKSNAELKTSIAQLKKTQKGLFAMIDYAHFKGSGLDPKERFTFTTKNESKEYGWGLKQVLEEMHNSGKEDIVEKFSDSAAVVLLRRSLSRREIDWFDGWLIRVEAYKNDF